MLSLADFPELAGFFSYSRRDDERSDGALSRLRARIYAELSMQLGRDLRVWQDTVAIPEGALWEAAINRAITESIFFIPIVTPSALGSAHCRFEFESFLKRETELGRDDLVFPILYVRVPALEKEEQWRSDDVLKVIGSRQYLDWQKVRYRSFTEAEVAEKISQYCGSIVEALRQPWVSLEERRRLEEAKAQKLAHERRLEAEAKRRADEEERRKEAEIKQRADEEQRRTEAETKLRQQAEYERAEAKRRADEEESRRQIEAEARQRADKERSRQEADANRRAEQEQEQAFAAAKRADNVAAFDAFLATYAEGPYAIEARNLRAMLAARDEAFKAAMAGNDAVVLKTFLKTYPNGSPAEQVGKHLRGLPVSVQRRQRRNFLLVGLVGLALFSIALFLVTKNDPTAPSDMRRGRPYNGDPDLNDLTMRAAGLGFQLKRNTQIVSFTELLGNSSPMLSIFNCLEKCAQNDACGVFQYHEGSKVCWMYRRVTEFRDNPDYEVGLRK
jgi:flagellar biosynthesis GTPase FlhF